MDDIRVVLVRREIVAGLRTCSTPGDNDPANLGWEAIDPLGAPGRIARSDWCGSCSERPSQRDGGSKQGRRRSGF
jgi:hypothetical protein